MPTTARLYIVYYSMYGHVARLIRAAEKGARRVPGVEVSVYQIRETLSEDILAKLKAAPKDETVPVLEPAELVDADGFMFGFPTRFGMVPAQVKALMDATGSLWVQNKLRDKLFSVCFSSNSQHGGQETTVLSTLPYFTHLGLHYVPFGFSHPALTETSEIVGGSAYGAGTVANAEGDRPSAKELSVAEAQGEHIAQQTLIKVLGEAALKELQQQG